MNSLPARLYSHTIFLVYIGCNLVMLIILLVLRGIGVLFNLGNDIQTMPIKGHPWPITLPMLASKGRLACQYHPSV